MHGNPVKRALVGSPEHWRWSSYRHYFLGEAGPVQVNVGWGEISFRDRAA
jgi:putative transposase